MCFNLCQNLCHKYPKLDRVEQWNAGLMKLRKRLQTKTDKGTRY
jgi:hypothetical protein